MQANPLNVIQLLTAIFSNMHIPDSPVNNQELQLAKGIESILRDAMLNYLNTEYAEEAGLDFQEQFKDWYYIDVEEDPDWTPPRKRKSCHSDDEEVSFEYKKNAVKYWTGCAKKKFRTLQQVQNKYKRVTSLKQLHSGRTLATAGMRKVECVVKSLSSTTHSYTVQPIISGDGKLLPKMLLVLKEQSGGFGPIVQRSLFKPDNVYITASTSGKMTSGKYNFPQYKYKALFTIFVF